MHVKRRFTAAVVAAGGLLLLAVFIGVQQFHSVNRDEIGREHFFLPGEAGAAGDQKQRRNASCCTPGNPGKQNSTRSAGSGRRAPLPGGARPY